MLCLDLYLQGLSGEELKKVANNIPPIRRNAPPLLSWGIGYPHHFIADRSSVTLHFLNAMKHKYNWQIELGELLQKPHDAVVLTDLTKTILWVSEGFERMTGYTLQFAKGKTLSFLQGPNTSQVSQETIRKKLRAGKPFTADLINYRKNGEEYLCRVSIHPLKNNTNIITHFIALESEVA